MRLAGKRIAILVAAEVEDLEFFVPLMRLKEEGAEVISAAADTKPLHGKHGLEIKPDVRIDTLRGEDLSGLVIPGGLGPGQITALPGCH